MSKPQKSLGPLVPIVPERLEKAREVARLSLKRLSDVSDVPQQTLDAIRHAVGTRRCRRAHRDRLAKALQLPDFAGNGSRWLGGEVDYLYVGVTLYEGGGSRFDYSSQPITLQLARFRLIERCREAWSRDQDRPRDSVTPPRPRAIPDGASFTFFQRAIEHLTSCVWWRDRILRGDTYPMTRAEYETQQERGPDGRPRTLREQVGPHGARLLLWDEMSQAEREEFIEHALPGQPSFTDEMADDIETGFIDAFTTLLEPWFNGEAELEYEQVLAMAGRRVLEVRHA